MTWHSAHPSNSNSSSPSPKSILTRFSCIIFSQVSQRVISLVLLELFVELLDGHNPRHRPLGTILGAEPNPTRRNRLAVVNDEWQEDHGAFLRLLAHCVTGFAVIVAFKV